MKDNRCLLLTGPVYLPDRVRDAMSKQMIERRGPDVKALMEEIIYGLKAVFKTSHDVLLFPASGTGGLELALINTLSPGDTVLSLSCGVFGDRFADIARTHKLNVIKTDFAWGEGVSIEKVKEILRQDSRKEIKALLITHNETSTGVANNLADLGLLAQEHGALALVDAISSLAGIDLRTDEWGLDIVVSASQKALMAAPGIVMVSVSPKAWTAIEKSQFTKYYWDLRWIKDFYGEKKLAPYTAPTSAMYGLKEALTMIFEEGLEQVLERHRVIAKALRAGIRAMGLELYVPDEWASATVTTVKYPPGIDGAAWRQTLRNKYWVSVAGGLGKIEAATFRVGHMGYIGRAQIIAGLSGMELALKDFNFPVELGASLVAAQRAFAEAGL
ncbi:MAG: pyridoxal-phosphate-dependent aminotransferase family protein [Bacillota bacterium]